MIKEFFLGTSIALVIFLILLGYDVVPLLMLIGLGVFLYVMIDRKGLTGGNGNFGSVQQVNFNFGDIGGQEPAKKELIEALDFVLHAGEASRMGIRPLKGILLTGPPGTGKTLLAKAAAAYTRSLFLAASGSEFIEVYAGVGAQRVRQLFRTARERALKEKKDGAVIFIDEIDVLGSRRGSNNGHLEYDQTLNQLLVEMDGLRSDERTRILVIGATNRDDMLDQALLRPGRFDRVVRVDLPDKAGRLQILRLHCRNKPLDDDVELEAIARETFGFSGAHLESVANEAAILAMREKSPKIQQRHFQEAVDKVIMGEKLDRKASQEELARVAIHETGHAVISEVLRPGSVSHLTVTNRGKALGYMRQIPEDDIYLYTREYMEAQMQICLGGAVAERILLGSQSTGASSDFQQVTQLARQIVVSGMSSLGIICEEMLSKDAIHQAMKEIINEQENNVEGILRSKIEVVERAAQLLREQEYLSGGSLREMLGLPNQEEGVA